MAYPFHKTESENFVLLLLSKEGRCSSAAWLVRCPEPVDRAPQRKRGLAPHDLLLHFDFALLFDELSRFEV